MEEEEEQPTSPHPGPEAFSLKMLVDSRNAGAVLGTRARRLASCHLACRERLYRRFPFFSFRNKREAVRGSKFYHLSVLKFLHRVL